MSRPEPLYRYLALSQESYNSMLAGEEDGGSWEGPFVTEDDARQFVESEYGVTAMVVDLGEAGAREWNRLTDEGSTPSELADLLRQGTVLGVHVADGGWEQAMEEAVNRRKPKRATKREPTPEEEGQQVLVDAAKAGADYAKDQVGGSYFRDWVWEQMVEGEAMRKRDPASVIPLETPSDAKKLARNMLQQLEWDTKRDMEASAILELSGAKGVFDVGSADWVRDKYGITYEEVSDNFFDAFVEELKNPITVHWLTDLVLTDLDEVRGTPKSKVVARERPTVRADRQSMLSTSADMKWLRDVHLPDLDLKKYRSAVLHGNEDYPTRIEVYTSRNPTVDDRPVTYEPDSEGKYHPIGGGVSEARRRRPIVRGDAHKKLVFAASSRGGKYRVEVYDDGDGTFSYRTFTSSSGTGGGASQPLSTMRDRARKFVSGEWDGVKYSTVERDDLGWLKSAGHASESRRPVVRDYVAVDPRGRKVAGPFTDYGDAKREADRARGFVRFASGTREASRPPARGRARVSRPRRPTR
jgi:hypothetical protein